MPACPMCAEPIAEGATKCASCGEALVRRRVLQAQGAMSMGRIVALCAIAAGVLYLLAAIVIPNLVSGRPARSGEGSAIGALKTINAAQMLFREGDEDGDGALDYGTLSELSATTLIDPLLGGGVKRGYTFQVAPSPTTPGSLWMAVASPTSPGTTGDRYFVTNQDGVIYYSLTAPFTLTPDCAIPTSAVPLGR